jgi:ribosomal protein S18 acetylase RimI-like enzyme
MYCEIWKEPPWNEDFWKPESVENDIHTQMAKPGAISCLAITDEGNVVGFTNGYLVTCDELASISKTDELRRYFQNGEMAFYLDELGVASTHRRQGIGHDLTRILIEALRTGREGCKIFLRTDQDAFQARNLYRALGFEDTGIHDGTHTTRTYWMRQN